jgi:hypothetical protein
MRSMSSAMMSWNDFDFQIEGAKMLMGLDVPQEGVRNANGPIVPQCSGVYEIEANINLMGPQHSLLVDLAFGI